MTRQMMFAISFRAGCAILGILFVGCGAFCRPKPEPEITKFAPPRCAGPGPCTPLDYRVGVTLGPHAALAVSRTTFLLYAGINTAFGKASLKLIQKGG